MHLETFPALSYIHHSCPHDPHIRAARVVCMYVVPGVPRGGLRLALARPALNSMPRRSVHASLLPYIRGEFGDHFPLVTDA